jgi:hypothetical protein
LNLGRAFAIAAAKIGKHNNLALSCVLNGLGSRRAGNGIVAGHSEPLNEPAQMLGHAFIDDVLPIAAKFVGYGGLFGTAQPHDVVASL